MSLPAHASANVSADRPIAGPSLVQTSTLTGPGAVTATFGSGSRSHASLDDTIEGYLDLGELSDSDMISMGDTPMPPDGTSGDDSDTLEADQVNLCMVSQTQEDAGADADNKDDTPDAPDRGHQCFLYGQSFSEVDMNKEGEEGDEERDGEDNADDAHDNATDSPPPAPTHITEGQGATRKRAPAFKNTSKHLWRLIIQRMQVSGNQQQPTLWTL